MKIQEQLYILFNIRKSEGDTVAKILLFSFFQNVGLALLFSTANVLYLSQVDIKTLPYVFVATAVLMLFLELVYERLEHIWTVGKIIMAILVGLTISMLVFRVVLGFGGNADWLLFTLIVWERVASLTANSEFGKVNAMIFDVRQSKRLFGLLGSAEIPAKIIGVLLAPLLITFSAISIEDMLIGSAVFLAISIFFFTNLKKRHKDKLDLVVRRGVTKIKKSNKTTFRKFITDFFGTRYVLYLGLFMFCVVGISVFVEYAFLKEVETAFSDQKNLAYFFGIFFALGQAVVFVAKTFFSGRIINKYGLKVSLNFLPFGLLFLTAIFFLSELFFGEIHLWVIGFMMLYTNITKSALTDPTFFTLFQPLDKKMRFEKYNAVGIVENLSYAIAGFTLIGINFIGEFSKAEPIILFVLLLAIVLVAAILVVKKIQPEYQNMLHKALESRTLEGIEVELQDVNSIGVVLEKLKSKHIGEVLYALNLLVKFEHPSLKKELPKLLQHSSEEVRFEVLKLIETKKLQRFESVVRVIIANPASNSRLKAKAINAYTAISSQDFVEEIAPYLNDSNEFLQTGAMIGLIRNGGISGIISAGEKLITLVSSPVERDRKFAAFIVGEVGIQNFYQPLMTLLNDSSEEVVKTALDAAGKIKNMRLAKRMVAQLAKPHVFESAGRSIIKLGKPALPFLEKAFQENTSDLKKLRRVAYISGRIGGKEASNSLKTKLSIVQPEIRNQILTSLDSTKYKATISESPKLIEFINRELDESTYLLLCIQAFREEKENPLLIDALHQELQQNLNRILLLLSFVFHKIQQVKANLFLDEREKKANAVEMLDVLLPSDLKRKIFPLLEDIPDKQKVDRLLAYFPKEQKNSEQFLLDLASPNCKFINVWTKAVALNTLKKYSNLDCETTLVHYLKDKHLLLSETAMVTLCQLQPEKFMEVLKYSSKSEREIMQKVKVQIDSEKKDKLFQIEKVLLLKTVSIFKDTSEEILTEIASILEEVDLKKGETVFEKGMEGDCMYVIFSGKVKVHDGDSIFAHLSDRDFFGELSLLDPEPRSASVTAVEDTFLLQLNQDVFYEIMADRIEVVRGIVRILIRRLRDQNTLISDLKNEVKTLT
jgi:AAA family ATP:ADP antiporter